MSQSNQNVGESQSLISDVGESLLLGVSLVINIPSS